jgi:hypothetical protein
VTDPTPAVSAPDATPSPLAQLRTRLEEERDKADRGSQSPTRDQVPPADQVAWINEGARSAFDEALHMLDQAATIRDRRMELLAAGRETWKAKALEMEADRDAIRESRDDWKAGVTLALQHAEKTEAAKARVRKLADRWRRIPRMEDAGNQVLAELDQPAGER